MRRIAVLSVLLVACGGAPASAPTPRDGAQTTATAPGAGTQTSATAPGAPVTVTHVEAPAIAPILPSGPYPVLLATADVAAQAKVRAAFMKANPGWQATLDPSGRFFTSRPASAVPALGTESGARAFVAANAATWGVDAAVFDHPVAHGDQFTFGVSRWGPYALGGFTVSPTSASGIFLGPSVLRRASSTTSGGNSSSWSRQRRPSIHAIPDRMGDVGRARPSRHTWAASRSSSIGRTC